MSLTRRTRLTRRTPLDSRSQLPRSPLASVSRSRRRAQPQRDAVWNEVRHRDRTCLLHGAHGEAITGQPCVGRLTPHHLRKAGQGGEFTAVNIVMLCAGHNGWVEDYPLTAYVQGFVVRAGETPDEAWARLFDRGWVPSPTGWAR